MKALRIFLFGIALGIAGITQAQVSVNLSFGTPPMWGPMGYSQVRYYYLPDVEAFYDVQSSMFIYYGGGKWVHRTYLPSRYRNYDLYSGYKVVMSDYQGNTPYVHYKEYKRKYTKGYHGHGQKTIGERPVKANYKNHRPPSRERSDNRSNYRSGSHNNEGHGNERKENKGHNEGREKKGKR